MSKMNVTMLEAVLAREFVGRVLRQFIKPPQVEISQIGVREGYRLWAPNYISETVTSHLDDELANAMLQGLPQSRLLDAGCGVGRRMRNIPGAVGIDLSAEMLAAENAHDVVAGDIRSMPFGSGRFDMVWCRLVLGHLQDPFPAYQEFHRICAPGGHVFVTDFHADGVRAGHRRTFNDNAGVVHVVEHYIHANHVDLASKAGLRVIARHEGVVGPSVRDFYIRGIGRKAYIRDFGLKLVSAFLFERP
jgi:malonyl-CoA O-methyltransferase